MTNLPEAQLNSFLNQKRSQDPQQTLPRDPSHPPGKQLHPGSFRAGPSPCLGWGGNVGFPQALTSAGPALPASGAASTCCHPQPPERHFQGFLHCWEMRWASPGK